MTTATKSALVTLLANWIKQRPGLEYGNYGNVSAYRSELRNITRQRHDAETLLASVALADNISASDILAAFPQAFSGRLSFDAENQKLEYCAGQYWPTEYRAAACAVLAYVLWAEARGHLKTGDELRKHFRQQFGAAIQKRWFD